MVDAYTTGVNAWLRTHHAPAEYKLLGNAPEPWEPWHCVAAMRQRGYLMGSLWFKLWRAAAFSVVGPDAVVKLRYDDGGADRLCIPPGSDANRWVASLADLAEPIRALSLLATGAETGGGSNNWALAPSRTASGRPLLAGDPHRAFELPGMYAQMQLACDEFDAVGFTIPGVPGFPHFGHNADVAWGVTHAFADIHDLYVEHFDQADPSCYRHRDAWLRANDDDRGHQGTGRGPGPGRHRRDHSRPGHRRRPGPRRRPDAQVGSVLRPRPVTGLPAPDAARRLGRLAVPGRARLGADRPQPGRRRHRRPHRPPGASHDPAPTGRQRLAAGAGLDR